MPLLLANNEWIFLLAGVSLAAAMLMLGIGIGIWAARVRRPLTTAQEVQAGGMLEMMGALRSWTHGFAGDVSEFQDRMRELQEQIDSQGLLSGGKSDPHAFELLSEMVKANEELKSRLDEAEGSLEEKAKEVSAYLSEARTDALTQVPNRRSFDDELARRFSEWQRYQSPFSMILVDVDHFKKFNDTHGHLAGDAVLQQVAQTLIDATRDSDQVARYGGEEFAAILPASEIGDARFVAQRICQFVAERTFTFEDKTFEVTVSVGAAQAIERDSVTTLIKRSDSALYEAKEAGRNRAYFHDGGTALPVIPSNSPLASDPDVPAKLLRVCDDLREKLIEVTRK